MDPFNPRQSSNHMDVNGEGNYMNPLPARGQDQPGFQNMDSPGDSLQGAQGVGLEQRGNYTSTYGQDYLLQPQPEIQGAGYPHPQMPYKNFPVNGGQVSSQPLMSEGSFHHDLVPQGPSFPGVIQPNPAFGSSFYLPPPNLFFPKEEYFHPHHGMMPMNPNAFSPAQLPFPPPHPFMLGLMPEYPSQVMSEPYQGPSMMPPSFSSGTACAAPRTSENEAFSTEMAHSYDPFGGRNKNFGEGDKGQLNERNNKGPDASKCNGNFQNKQSKQMSINSANKIADKVWKPENKSPIVETRNHVSNMIPNENTLLSPKDGAKMEILPKENRLLSPKDRTAMNSENKFCHSITNASQVSPIPPRSSSLMLIPQFSIQRGKRQTKTYCPKPRSTLTTPKRKTSLSDLSTAAPFKLTSPTPVTPEQLEATRMKMVFSPKLVADTPCSGCTKHKSQMTVQCASPPVEELSDDLAFGGVTLDGVTEDNVTLDVLLCEMCGTFLELDPNEIINVSYLMGDNNSGEPIFSDQFFDDSPLGNIQCSQTSLTGKVKKTFEEIIIISDEDDIKSPIGKSRSSMQFKGKLKQRSNESKTGTIKKEITRPFACNACSKTYIREHALKAHMKTHLGYSPVKLSVESIPNESNTSEVNVKLVSPNADNESNSHDTFIQKSSITDDEINELLISSDDEAAPLIFMPKLESTIKKESMENTNTQFEIKEDISEARNEGEYLFMMKEKIEDSFNIAQDLNEKIMPPVCCPQIMKESAKNEKIKAKRPIPRTCWYCLSLVSIGPWQVHKYQPNKYLCSSCFEMHKAKAEKKEKEENHLPKVPCEGFEETRKAEELEKVMALGSDQNMRQDVNKSMESQLVPDIGLE